MKLYAELTGSDVIRRTKRAVRVALAAGGSVWIENSAVREADDGTVMVERGALKRKIAELKAITAGTLLRRNERERAQRREIRASR